MARMLNTNSHQTLIASPPEHLIFDNILPRLPGKSLIRFKLVCKSWLSIISSIHFAKCHLKFSSLCPKFAALNSNYSLSITKLYLLPSDDGNKNRNVSELDTLDLDRNWICDELNLVGGCNGLLCFVLEDKHGITDHFRVWNPVTRQCRKIMYPQGENTAGNYGFSYASSIDDYKIVSQFFRMSCCPPCRSFYFSLRSSEWKMITDIDFPPSIRNTLFYPAKDVDCWQEKSIVGFDIVDEKLKEIPFMNWLSGYKWADFCVIKDCVSLVCDGDHGSDVWVFKEYGDWKSWEKMYSFDFGGMYFLNITDTCKCLVQSSSSAQLKVIGLNPNDSPVGIDFSGQIRGTGAYVESLISPFFGR